jgi:fructose-bisphosphate aldolase class I
MNAQDLIETAKMLVADYKGLLAMDESNPTCNKRFAKLGIPQTEEARRAYRELIITTPSLGEYISGAILYDETIRQHKQDGTPFIQVITEAGIIPGIKVDMGAKGTPKNKISKTFVLTAQRSSPVNVGAPGIEAPTPTFLSVQRLEDLYFAIP